MVLAILMVVGWIGIRRLGFETPVQQALITPRTAAAALDSLSRLDLSTPLAIAAGPAVVCSGPHDARYVGPATVDQAELPLGFGDTFPPASAHHQLWKQLGATVRLVTDSNGVRLDSGPLPPAQILLAAIRWRLDRDDRPGACLVLGTVLRRARALQARRDLSAISAGAQVERDAMSMVSRGPALAGNESRRARAAARVAELDRRVPAWRSLHRLIDVAGTAPSGLETLAAWARDATLPMPVRDALVRAVGYGWVLDPQEGALRVAEGRRTVIGLLARDLPEPLRAVADSAHAVAESDLPTRFRFTLTYRSQQMTPPW